MLRTLAEVAVGPTAPSYAAGALWVAVRSARQRIEGGEPYRSGRTAE
jgi:hypothetical protein